METNELDYLNRSELFEKLKDKCKSIVKRDFYAWLICCLLIIPLFFTGVKLDSTKNILYFIFWIAFVCLGGWLSLFNYRFLKQFDNLDTPERLLYWFKKKHRYNIIIWVVACIGILGTYLIAFGFSIGTYLGAAVFIGMMVVIYFNGGPLWHLKEEYLIERLQELAEKK